MIPSLTHSPDISLLHFGVHCLAKLVSLPFIRKVQTYREFLCVCEREREKEREKERGIASCCQ